MSYLFKYNSYTNKMLIVEFPKDNIDPKDNKWMKQIVNELLPTK